MKPSLELADSLIAHAAEAIKQASQSLLDRQDAEGYWCSDLTADTTLESDYIMMELWLHPPVNGAWRPPHADRIQKAASAILRRQLPDGGFNIYPHGPAEINASIKAYFALKLSGVSLSDLRMERLRERILELGGIQAANSYVHINLSLFKLFPRDACPAIPPELILLPGKFIYQMSSWTRAIVIALAIVHSADPQRPVPEGFTLKELFLPGEPLGPTRDKSLFTVRNAFLVLDKFAKGWAKWGSKTIRNHAIKKCEEWMIERMDASDGLGAIYPAMQYSVMALDVLHYQPGHPKRKAALGEFLRLMVDDERGFYFRPCFSPVWDTAIAAFSLAEAEVLPETALHRSVEWLLSKEIRRRGDWSVKRPNLEPSGWCFEFKNEFYPDIDDTAMALLALTRAKATDGVKQQACMKRAINWLLAMQGKDGGWAAFDVDNNWQFLSNIPFADHNAMLDPSCPDVTGRVIEALCRSGLPPNHAAVRRGVEYLFNSQEADGSWYGRWGVDYLYGTFLALRGLQSASINDREPQIQRALEWIRAYQNADGGWGESCASYENNAFTPGQSTASQTAWAILGLLAGGDTRSISLHTGVEYLLRGRRTDGTWHEEHATGTGFPKVFYLIYTEYRNAFPILALAAFKKAKSALQDEL
jgi:squalene-hopene/tetraprenyl-beta-curcumene cyclase